MRCDRRVHATVDTPRHTQYFDQGSLPLSAGELTETAGQYKNVSAEISGDQPW
jgi:hypothetical protein